MGTSSAAAHTVFVYGTLLADEVVSILLQRVPQSSPALLPDFHRFSIKGCVYPAILPAKGDKVNGKVLFGITNQELEVLDDFEDVEYTRQVVEPILLNGFNCPPTEGEESCKLQSYVYVWDNMDDEKLFGDWDYEEWRKRHLQEYTSMCSRYASEKKCDRMDVYKEYFK